MVSSHLKMTATSHDAVEFALTAGVAAIVASAAGEKYLAPVLALLKMPVLVEVGHPLEGAAELRAAFAQNLVSKSLKVAATSLVAWVLAEQPELVVGEAQKLLKGYSASTSAHQSWNV